MCSGCLFMISCVMQSIAPLESSEGPTEGVVISTIHAAKGLEYDCVFIPGLQDGLLPHERALQQLDAVRFFFIKNIKNIAIFICLGPTVFSCSLDVQGNTNEIDEERRLLFVSASSLPFHICFYGPIEFLLCSLFSFLSLFLSFSFSFSFSFSLTLSPLSSFCRVFSLLNAA